MAKTATANLKAMASKPDGVETGQRRNISAEVPAHLLQSMRGQLQAKLSGPNCTMERVAANTGCYGSMNYKTRIIEGATWSTVRKGDKGGQYRIFDGGLHKASRVCNTDPDCHFVWISASDEAGGGDGARLLPTCNRVELAGAKQRFTLK